MSKNNELLAISKDIVELPLNVIDDIRGYRWELMKRHLEMVTKASQPDTKLTDKQVKGLRRISERLFEFQSKLTEVAAILEDTEIAQLSKSMEFVDEKSNTELKSKCSKAAPC